MIVTVLGRDVELDICKEEGMVLVPQAEARVFPISN